MNNFNIFNADLTRFNALANGYEYMNDVRYNINQIDASLQNILNFVIEHDCKLGESERKEEHYFGLYVPLERLTEELIGEMKRASFVDLKQYNSRKLEKIMNDLYEIVGQ